MSYTDGKTGLWNTIRDILGYSFVPPAVIMIVCILVSVIWALVKWLS